MSSQVLVGLLGTSLDGVLGLLAEHGNAEIRGLVRDTRIALRAGQPTNRFVRPAGAETWMRAQLKSSTGVKAALLTDALSLLDGSKTALEVYRAWPDISRLETPPDIEYAAFDTSRSFEAVAESINAIVTRHDPLELVIRGHLWIEYSLNQLLTRALAKPEHIEKARLTFSQRLALAGALGLVAEDELSAIRAINRARNRLAHELEGAVTEEDEERILEAAGPRLRRIVEKPLPPDSEVTVRTAGLIYCLLVRLHSHIDHHDTHRRYDAFIERLVDEALADRG